MIPRGTAAYWHVTATSRKVSRRISHVTRTVDICASDSVTTIYRESDGLGEALNVGDIVCLGGKIVASIKVKLCHCATFALGTTVAVLSKDTSVPLSVDVQSLARTRVEPTGLRPSIGYCGVGHST